MYCVTSEVALHEYIFIYIYMYVSYYQPFSLNRLSDLTGLFIIVDKVQKLVAPVRLVQIRIRIRATRNLTYICFKLSVCSN